MATTSTSFAEKFEARIKGLPRDPGVYVFKDTNGQVIYVGKAKDLRTRVSNYLREGGDGRHQVRFLLARAQSLECMVTATEQEALILENNLIKKHRPRYNIFLRDDKTYVNVRLNVDHPFPRLTVVRRPRKDKARYFGPYASAGAVRATLRMLGKVFPLRTCSDVELASRKRPCLYYHLGRCPAPCVGFVDEQSYKETVNKVLMFLKGRGDELVKSLTDKMMRAAAERQYEQAAKIRDELFALQRVLERQRVRSPQSADRDVFGVCREKQRLAIQVLHVRDAQLSGGTAHFFDNAALATSEHLSSFINQYYQSGAAVPAEIAIPEPLEDRNTLEAFLSQRREGSVRIAVPRRGERRRLLDLAVQNARAVLDARGGATRYRELLEDLEDVLELERFPRRIECFDVSNFQGAEAAASRATFIDGEPVKSLYRHYRVKTVKGADDYAMMEEVLERRIARGLVEADLPDLLMVDGGKGQMNVALKVMDRLGVKGVGVVGIAKVRDDGRKRRVRGEERLYAPSLDRPLLLREGAGPLHLLERIRDEAHRFAIGYHKRLRAKRFEASVLDGVLGVGPVLKRRLLAAFGSVARIREAEVTELCAVQGVSQGLAARIKAHLEHRS
jgi:excinuclease ABC subunit C